MHGGKCNLVFKRFTLLQLLTPVSKKLSVVERGVNYIANFLPKCSVSSYDSANAQCQLHNTQLGVFPKWRDFEHFTSRMSHRKNSERK